MPCALHPGSIDEVERLLVNVVSIAMSRAENIKQEGEWKEMAEQVCDIQAKLSQPDHLASWVTHAEQKAKQLHAAGLQKRLQVAARTASVDKPSLKSVEAVGAVWHELEPAL
eukprot:6474350-Amphidinium_carterae.3